MPEHAFMEPLRPTQGDAPPIPQCMRNCAAVSDRQRTRGAAGWMMKVGSMAPIVDPAVAERTYYTREEVAKHNTQDDAWMILNERVYDVTAYINGGHPVAGSLNPYLGGDGTLMKMKIHAYVNCHALLRPFFLGHVGSPPENIPPVPESDGNGSSQ